MRRWLLALVALLFMGCGARKPVTLLSMDMLTASGLTTESASEWQLPSHLTLSAEVDNQGSKVVVGEARLKVSYRGRRVLMLWSEQPFAIPARCRSRVVVPLRLALQRNSQSMPLQQALSRRDLSEVTLDVEFRVRRGVATGRIERSHIPATEFLTPAQQEQLWKILE